MAEHNELGKWGEELAAKYLEQKGYVIRDRDWRQGKLDLDIVAVADDGETVVFVEVKARKTNAFGQPEQAVDAKKIKRLARAADSYVKSLGVSAPLRFDIVSIIGDQKEVQTTMNKYELALVVDAKIEEDARVATVEKAKDYVTKFGGTITEVEEWGKKKLAYEIQHMKEGYYYFIKFDGEATVPGELEQAVRIMDNVLRYLCVRQEA